MLAVVKRSWKRLLVLLLLGAVLPSIGVLLVLAVVVLGPLVVLRYNGAPLGPEVFVPVAIVLYLTAAVSLLYLSSVTSLASLKVATTDAAGHTVPLGQAYRSCLRLGWPTAGWTLLAGLVTALGVLACFVPFLYLTVALSLVVPIMLFQRRNGFAESFRLVHTNFWPVVGRIAALYGLVSVASFVMQLLSYVVMIPATAMFTPGEDPSIAGIVVFAVVFVGMTVLGVFASLLGQVVMLCGQLVTYAELRGRAQPGLTTAHLVAELPA